MENEIKKAKILKYKVRLIFINLLYESKEVKEAINVVGIKLSTGYQWRKLWNEGGKESLIPKRPPGRRPRLGKNQMERLKELLELKDHWQTVEVMRLIKKEFKIKYSINQTRRIMKKLGMRFSKPYTMDYRRAEGAEEILKE